MKPGRNSVGNEEELGMSGIGNTVGVLPAEGYAAYFYPDEKAAEAGEHTTYTPVIGWAITTNGTGWPLIVNGNGVASTTMMVAMELKNVIRVRRQES
jgi:hypothetical protein